MNDTRFSVLVGDITTRKVSAIVNAANSSLLGGGGVDGAIHRAGGPSILAECRRIRETEWPDGLPTGEAVITTAGDLPSSWVIHTVGPIWHGGTEDERGLLARAVDSCLRLAARASDPPIDSIAFPAISTGVYGFPRELAYPIITDRIEHHLADTPTTELSQVELVLFSPKDLDLYHHVCR